MMYIWHEWKNKRDNLKSIETERKTANKRIWKNLNAELKAARYAKDWDKSNYLKQQISNHRYQKRGQWGLQIPFDARHDFRKWDY
jgi:hypothetical protein